MRISEVETIVSPRQPNVCIVQLRTDDGLTGLGETFYGSDAVEAYVHTEAAPVLFDLDVHVAPEPAAEALATYVGYQGSGVEIRGNSAIDIALWDLVGKVAGLPLREVLGGAVQDTIRVYNTCAGNNYVSSGTRQTSANWGVSDEPSRSENEDLWAFLNQPGELAKELVAAGYPGMKVWPFDLAAEISRGSPHADLGEGLRVLSAIRDAVGGDIDLYLELHGLWTLPGATRLLTAVEEFDLTWVEDAIRPDRIDALGKLAQNTNATLAGGETLAGRQGYKPLLDAGALDVAIVDLGWTGGISEARKIAALTDTYGVLVAPHDCTGPITLAAGLHWVTSSRNGFVQEMSRAFYYGWYSDYVSGLPVLAGGAMRPSDGPGLGVELNPGLLSESDTRLRRTRR